jgi:hypothetical protein
MSFVLDELIADFADCFRSPVPGGDLRDARPYMIVNTGLRRLGCGGRAALGMDSPT